MGAYHHSLSGSEALVSVSQIFGQELRRSNDPSRRERSEMKGPPLRKPLRRYENL